MESNSDTSGFEYVVVASSYEKTLFGYTFSLSSPSLTPRFICIAHDSCIKCVAARGNIFLSGGTDETLKVFDVVKGSELLSIPENESGINALEYFDEKHVLCANENGNISLWNLPDWQCMVRLIGHKKGVLSLSVHPSNRLAISTSKDGTMKMWNLIKGKCAFTNKLEKQAQVVLWSPAAKSYAMVFEKEIKVFDASNGNTLHSITNSTPIHSILFLKEDEIVSGDEEGQIKRWRFKEDKFHVSFAAHQKRVKALSFVPSQHKLNNKHIVSVSSDGSIKLWDIDSAQLLASVSTTARLTAVTCLQLSNPSSSSSTQSNNASSKDNNASSKSNNTAHPSPSAAKEKKQRKKQKLNK